ncbi:uncharacterized protein [Argopecten irradians]|uniref:uncharacterized protein n=1 Tax=Argopecten irradians TaxID=31199 RepID=UPI0037167FE3
MTEKEQALVNPGNWLATEAARAEVINTAGTFRRAWTQCLETKSDPDTDWNHCIYGYQQEFGESVWGQSRGLDPTTVAGRHQLHQGHRSTVLTVCVTWDKPSRNCPRLWSDTPAQMDTCLPPRCPSLGSTSDS